MTTSKRIKLDFYETPAWQTRALLARQQISGTVLECCVGDGSLAKELGQCRVFTNDIDPARPADFHSDATLSESWLQFPQVDWVVTNPPFICAMPILKLAHQKARYGVVMLLRLSFMEPTKERGPWLNRTPPQRQLILPRWSYKRNGNTDSVTTAWFIWNKQYPAIEIIDLNEKQFDEPCELLAVKG